MFDCIVYFLDYILHVQGAERKQKALLFTMFTQKKTKTLKVYQNMVLGWGWGVVNYSEIFRSHMGLESTPPPPPSKGEG